MNLRKILTSFTFRFMLIYVVVLSLAVFLVMALIYGIFTYSYFQDLRAAIVDELDVLTLIYEGQGAPGVEQYVLDQQNQAGSGRFQYLLTDADYNKLAGTLVRWPDYREFGDGWVAFGLSVSDFTSSDEPRLELLARPYTLDDGSHLLTALRYGDVLESVQLVLRTLIRTTLATLLLGVIGGFVAAAATLRRVETLNEGISDIVHGDLSQRIPLGDAVGNMRELIDNFNHMLDQTESLMAGVRTVSDNIAHDLRTPLTRIRNNLVELQLQVPMEEERVQAIIEECDGILATFNALLRIAQLEAGNRISSFSSFDIGTLVRDVVELYEPFAQDKQLALHCWCEESQYDGDRDLLFQMVANLLDNAVKYTPSGGRISVSLTSTESGKPLLAVADNGPGIPVADRENVFRRFFRLESSRSLHAGSGLGLSLVQAVVKLHRGRITMLDNYPGLRVEVKLG